MKCGGQKMDKYFSEYNNIFLKNKQKVEAISTLILHKTTDEHFKER